MKDNPIYNAQCFGNIEPIEYMVPYPNLRSLAVGQCIKFSNNILFKEKNISNSDFLKSINRTANWLAHQNIQKGDRIVVINITSPMMEILSYAIWSLGAVLVISNDDEINTAKEKIHPKLVIDKFTPKVQREISDHSDKYIETSTTLLSAEAVIYFNNNNGIRLSHYNLLINAYGAQKHLNILHKDVLNIDIPHNTTAGIVLRTILPLYAGVTVSDKPADINFSVKNNADYQVIFDWKIIPDDATNNLFILPEATAILAIGNTPNHLLSIIKEDNTHKINGHSVMIGYLDEEENNKVFKSGSLIISR